MSEEVVSQQEQSAPEVAPEQGLTPEQQLEEAVKPMLAGYNATEAQPATDSPKDSPGEEKSPEIQKLIDKDAEIARAKRELAAERKAIEEHNRLRALAKKDPRAALEELGIDPWQVALADVPGEDKSEKAEETDLAKELRELKEWKASQEKREQEIRSQQAYESGIKASTKYLEENADKYKLTAKHPRGKEYLLETLRAKYQQDKEYYDSRKEFPSYDDVAENVETYLRNEAQQALSYLSQFKDDILKDLWSKHVGMVPAKQPPRPTTTNQTLSNEMTSERHTTEEPLGEEDRVKAAVRALQQLRTAEAA